MKRMMMLALVLLLISCSSAQQEADNQELIAEIVEKTLAAAKEPEPSDYSVLLKPNPGNETLTDVYIVNNATGQETFFATHEDVAVNQYASEYHNGNVYIVKEIGYDPGTDDQDWINELWKYDANGIGTKLFENKGISFRVSPDESYIAIRYLPEGADMITGGKLAFFDSQANLVQEFSSQQFRVEQARLSLQEWSDDSSALWVSLHHVGPRPQAFVKINVDSWQPDIYIFSGFPVGAEYDLNANMAKLVYSDHPVFFDVTSAQEFEDGINTVTLFVYDFNTQSEQVIATSISKLFHPRWLDDRTIEYDDPSGDGKIVVTVD